MQLRNRLAQFHTGNTYWIFNIVHSSQTSSFRDICKYLSNEAAVFWMHTEVYSEWWSDVECIHAAGCTSRYIHLRLHNSPWWALEILSTVILCPHGFCCWIPACLRQVANSDFLKMIIQYWTSYFTLYKCYVKLFTSL